MSRSYMSWPTFECRTGASDTHAAILPVEVYHGTDELIRYGLSPEFPETLFGEAEAKGGPPEYCARHGRRL